MTKKKAFKSRSDRNIFLLSLLVALLFWIAIRFSQDYTHNYKFAIDYQLPDSISFTTIPTDDIGVELTGTGWELFTTSLKKDFKTIEMPTSRSLVPRNQIIDAVRDNLGNSEIFVESVDMDYIEIELEQKMQRRLPVRIDLDIGYAAGKTLRGDITFEPDSITLTGPGSKVAAFKFWTAQKVSLANLETDTEVTTKVDLSPDASLRVDVEQILVKVPVEQLTEKSIYVEIKPPDADAPIRLFPDKVLVTTNVGLSNYEKFGAEAFEVALGEIDWSNTSSVPVVLRKVPEFIKSVQFSPKTVQLFVLEAEVSDSVQQNLD